MIKGNTFSREDNEGGMGYCEYSWCEVDQTFYCPDNYLCSCRDCEYYKEIEEEEE